MREKFQRFMAGRYGVDELSKFLNIVLLILVVLSLFIHSGILYLLALGILIYSYFRMFSKNVAKRYEENQKFVNFRYRRTVNWNRFKNRFAQRKEYRFYRCPHCSQTVRVPRGRGKICITCPKCRTEFVKKS